MGPAGDRLRAPGPGSAAPDFALRTLDGGTVTLSALRGRAVVLDFWAPWCGPCRAEAPSLVVLDAKYRSQGPVILGAVADDSPRGTVEEFARAFRVGYRVGPGRPSRARTGGAELLPQAFFIGRDGRIASVAVGFESRDALERRVREILRQRPGA